MFFTVQNSIRPLEGNVAQNQPEYIMSMRRERHFKKK